LEVIPAVDLMNGRVVRLVKGDPKSVIVYGDDPLAFVRRWVGMGARRIHVVDLDATLGLGGNLGWVERIVRKSGAPVQFGGGVRSLDSARRILNLGVDRVILGTLAFRDRSAVEALLREFGCRRVMVALDYRGGRVVVRGWTSPTDLGVLEALEIFSSLGVRIFLLTDVGRDGMLIGPDLDGVREACRLGFDVVVGGGVCSVDDIVALRDAGAAGVVLGRSLYEGRVDLREALSAVGG